ncbi:MAG: thiazole synthase [Chthoniobacteraceae bacterium]
MSELVIGGRSLSSRFLLGTGKFKSKQELQEVIQRSKTSVVTVALRRVDIEKNEDNIVSYIPEGVTLLANTSGARNAKEAVRIARMSRETGLGNWVKIEIMTDSKYLLPDNQETIKATEILAAEGFVVLPYVSPDLYVARDLVKAGAAAVMPLGSLIGSNQGLRTRTLLEVLINEIHEVPIIVDAGIGRPSHAAEAMEIGADAVLVNTAVASAEHPALMAEAFALAVAAGRLAWEAGAGEQSAIARASSPLTGFLHE